MLVPVPVRLTDCGLPVALSVTVTAAVGVPLALGVKVTLIVQLAPAATELPQVLIWEKSLALVPVTARLEIVSVVPPVLVSVTACALLLVPTPWLVNVKPVGANVTVPPVAVPVPVKLTAWGLPVALSTTVTRAARPPLADGVKVTAIVQLVPAVTELPHVLVWAKSLALVPVSAMLVILNAALPELVRVIV